jgi:ubiquinone/menaquinone biosynthesis C-methylase UbiE
MKTLEAVLVEAMECCDKELLPFMPYILQDFWELGSSAETIIALVEKHNKKDNTKVLDLGCGKGAVSIKIAKKLRYNCYGIDAIPDFVNSARGKAKEFQVDKLCKFEVGDIREKVKGLSNFDIIILGSVGPVFGDYYETLTTLKKCLSKDGVIIIDDGYIDDTSDFSHPQVLKKYELLKQINNADMQLIDEVIALADEKITENYDTEYHNLKRRCEELLAQHPEKKKLFLDYLKNQEKEYNNLKTEIICSTMVFKIIGKMI